MMRWLRGTGKKVVNMLRCIQLSSMAATIEKSGRNLALIPRDPEIGSAAYYLKHKRGLAILVTCNNGNGQQQLDTDRDACQMLATLECHLDYKVYQLQNKAATKKAISGLLEKITGELSHYNGPYLNDDQRHKAIIFAFSGHGDRVCVNDGNCTSNGEKEDVISTYDTNEYLRLKKDVLQKLMVPNLIDIPKLFFIDACRGEKTFNQLKARRRPEFRGQAETGGQEAEEVNYRIDYSTIPGYDAKDPAQWMITVAKLLRGESLDSSASLCATSNTNRDLSLGDVMSEARKHVIECSEIPQIPETATDRLKTGPLYLLPKPRARKLTLTLSLQS